MKFVKCLLYATALAFSFQCFSHEDAGRLSNTINTQVIDLTGQSLDDSKLNSVLEIIRNGDIKELIVTVSLLTQSQIDAFQLCAAECKGLRIISSDGQRIGNLFTNWAPYLEEKRDAHEIEGMYESTKTAFVLFQNEYHRLPEQVLDFACGTGQDSISLAKAGCQHIIAIDADDQAIAILKSNLPLHLSDRVQCINTCFKKLENSLKVDFFVCTFTLPYRPPYDFPACWKKCVDSIIAGGYFCGEFFGPKADRDPEIGMTYHTENEAKALLEKDFTILWFKTEPETSEFIVFGNTEPAWGDLYHFVARKKGTGLIKALSSP